MLTDRGGLPTLIETMVKVMAVNFLEPIANKDKLFKPALRTMWMVANAMDSLEFFLINTALCYECEDATDVLPFDREWNKSSNNIWIYLNNVIHRVVEEGLVITNYRVTLKRPDGVAVESKLVTREKLRNFYASMRMQFDQLLYGLCEYFRLPTIEELAVDLLHCNEISLMESRFKAKPSLLDLFPTEYLKGLLPMFNRYKSLYEHELCDVLQAIDKMIEPLIWMVFLGSGYSYRFSELVALTFAGRDRSIFIDEETRCLLLFTTYSKGDTFKPLTKRLDPKILI
ncbi:LAFA_0E15588g1_1 [Lachancea sp. 'fantastica']|nr:LAFA_0E15588g1_1 [Lachancea sp. 'fantastica']